MARTSRNGTPATSFDALDNIDIDDMFADDGDALFDGLDIDLDQMGDITSNMDTVGGDAAVEITKEKAKEDKPAPAPVVEELPKRRKTTRKSKSPALYEDEDDEPPRKKKSRSVKSTLNKKKSSKKEKPKDEPKVEVPKTKSKIRGMALPTALSRQSTGPSTSSQGIVAAAGQFGGRQKRGQFALPLSRTTSDKLKTKSKSSSSKATGSSADVTVQSNDKIKLKKSPSVPSSISSPPVSEPPKPKPPPAFVPPSPQSSFCGLHASNTMFYPFMPSLPTEPSIKNRKQYPVMDKIQSSMNTTNTGKGADGTGNPASDSENIFRLMYEVMKDQNIGHSSQATSQDDKKSVISGAIGSARQTVSGLEKSVLAGELFSVCSLLKRQYDFLQQNLANMEQWCKANFSESDYKATYGLPDHLKKQKEASSVQPLLATFKKPLVKIKVRLVGFKPPKQSGPLTAALPHLAGKSTSGASDKKSKKRKSLTEGSSAPGTLPSVMEKEVVIKTYPELNPAKRRRAIVEHISHTAKELEAACISRTAVRCGAIDRRHAELKSMVEEDEVLVIHTSAMWKYMKAAGYFSEFSEEAVKDTLRSVWAPEVKYEGRRAEIGKVSTIQTNDHAAGAKGNSTFEGLHSLLVEESSDCEEPVDWVDDSDGDDNDDDSSLLENVDEHIQSPVETTFQACVDVSCLSLDERSFMHLQKAGLFDGEFVSVEHVLKRMSHSSGERKNLTANGVTENQTGGDECSLEDIVERMSADLLELNKTNNARASYLEAVARTHLDTSRNSKSKAEEEAALIAKCQRLLEKSKEFKVKAPNSKPGSNDEYALPW